MSKKIREDYYGPGWGRSAPIMVERDLAGRKPFHEAAVHLLMTKYHTPLAALVVEFTHHDPKFRRSNPHWLGSAHQWSGRTRDLTNQLSIQLRRDAGWKGWSESRRYKELENLLELESPEDIRRFCGQMRTCAYVLKDVGVKVSWEKLTDRKAVTNEKYTYLWWTLESPRWR